jgi:TolB protein
LARIQARLSLFWGIFALTKRQQKQLFGLLAVVCGGCAASGDARPGGGTLPALNKAAPSVCAPLRQSDFAFTSAADGDSEIYLYRAASASIVRISANDVQDHWASWSPDGRMLAFQSLRDGNREVYIRNLATDTPVNVSQNDAQDLLPSWSPNGEYIAYFSSRDIPWSGTGPIGGFIYVMRVQGAVTGRLQTAPFASPSAVTWSADSKTMYFARYAPDTPGIYALDLHSGVETALLILDGKSPGIASANPVPGTIDYYVEHDGAVDIYQLSLDDGTSRRLTPGNGHHYYVSWSPDRSALLTTSARDKQGRVYDIRCIAADGSYDVAVIDDASDARAAAWRPGG